MLDVSLLQLCAPEGTTNHCYDYFFFAHWQLCQGDIVLQKPIILLLPWFYFKINLKSFNFEIKLTVSVSKKFQWQCFESTVKTDSLIFRIWLA